MCVRITFPVEDRVEQGILPPPDDVLPGIMNARPRSHSPLRVTPDVVLTDLPEIRSRSRSPVNKCSILRLIPHTHV